MPYAWLPCTAICQRPLKSSGEAERYSDPTRTWRLPVRSNPAKSYMWATCVKIGHFSLPSSFYRKDESLPPEMRYYDGKPPEVMKFGTAWQGANFESIDKTTEVAPGVTLIALVSDAPGTRELRELSLAVNTPDGLVLVVGCSHPGIDNIVEAAAAINPKIHLIAGGFHLVVAQDDVIARTVASLKGRFKVENVAPGHCTGEPTFAALKQAFGSRYIYAGIGVSLSLGANIGGGERRGERPALDGEDLTTYRKLARREDPFGVATRTLP
jgi:7,8-dihydropterin-6-yl-methyl-4-(beta-D-ribofuranosyl)aminobenzene 5'-phosphate synthase